MRKALSILIALTIIIGMIPTAFASTTEEPYAKTYEFTREGLNGVTGGKNMLSEVTYTYGSGNHGWEFFGYSGDMDSDKEEGNDTPGKVGCVSSSLRFYLKTSFNNNVKIDKNSAFALLIKAPVSDESGFYLPSIKWHNNTSGAKFDWYMSNKITDTFDDSNDGKYKIDANLMISDCYHEEQIMATASLPEQSSKVIYVSGEEELVSTVQFKSTSDFGFLGITLTQVLNPEIDITADKAVDGTIAFMTTDTDKTAVITSTKVSGNGIGPMDVAGGFVEYKSDNTGVATVDAATGEITAGDIEGTAKIWAQSPDGKIKSNEITITVTAPAGPEEDTEIADAFTVTEDKTTITSYNVGTVSAVAYTLGTDEQDSSVSATAQNNGNGTYTLNASEAEGYKFLYWKKGVTTKKDVITYEPTGFVYAPTAGEKNIVIAVYEKIGEQAANKAEFYNANGQFIEATDGSFPEDIPSLVGYGDATGWKCYTDGKTYGLSDSVTPNGTMLFVADYKDTPDIVDVTVNKGYGDNHTATVGTKITCNPVTAPEGQVFRYWTKTNVNGKTEIVSIDETYTFYAYETCTVTAIFADENKYEYTGNIRKIILDTFTTGSATALMAEFIGFEKDNVVEKGIMLDNNRIAMKSTGTQFTIIPDEKGTYMGYAIVKNDDNSFSLITDGEYKVQ